jgi:hypothetical protein
MRRLASTSHSICESDVEEFALAGSADVNARGGHAAFVFRSIAGKVGTGVGGDVRG